MAVFIKYYEGTWVRTKKEYYIFTWGFVKYKRTIAHSENCLPELEIKAGYSKFSGFFKSVGSISIDSTFNFEFASICTRENPISGKPMDFTPEVEYGFNRDELSHTLDRPLVNPPSKFWRDSTQTKIITTTFQIDDSLRFKNEGHYEIVYLVDKNINDPKSTEYIIKFLSRNINLFTK